MIDKYCVVCSICISSLHEHFHLIYDSDQVLFASFYPTSCFSTINIRIIVLDCLSDVWLVLKRAHCLHVGGTLTHKIVAPTKINAGDIFVGLV